jgi:hypothetical protein
MVLGHAGRDGTGTRVEGEPGEKAGVGVRPAGVSNDKGVAAAFALEAHPVRHPPNDRMKEHQRLDES